MTALTYFGFSVRINHHRRKLAQLLPVNIQESSWVSTSQVTQQNSSSGISQNQSSGNQPIPSSSHFACFSKSKASITFAAIVFLSMTIMTESFMWSYVTNNMTPNQIMDDSFGTFVVYWHQNFGPTIFAWGFLTISYSKNPALRKSKTAHF